MILLKFCRFCRDAARRAGLSATTELLVVISKQKTELLLEVSHSHRLNLSSLAITVLHFIITYSIMFSRTYRSYCRSYRNIR